MNNIHKCPPQNLTDQKVQTPSLAEGDKKHRWKTGLKRELSLFKSSVKELNLKVTKGKSYILIFAN